MLDTIKLRNGWKWDVPFFSFDPLVTRVKLKTSQYVVEENII